MKSITAKYAEKLLQELGHDYGNDGRTFYATNEEEDEVWEFDSKKERDEFVNRVNKQRRNNPQEGQGKDMKKYNVIHVSTYSGKETIIRKNVSLYEANEAFYGIDNTYIVEVDE